MFKLYFKVNVVSFLEMLFSTKIPGRIPDAPQHIGHPPYLENIL